MGLTVEAGRRGGLRRTSPGSTAGGSGVRAAGAGARTRNSTSKTLSHLASLFNDDDYRSDLRRAHSNQQLFQVAVELGSGTTPRVLALTGCPLMKLTILSGRSGSGKTTALQALEDHGYYCVGQSAPGSVAHPHRTARHTEEHAPERVAVGVDARNLPRQLLGVQRALSRALKNQQVETEVIFLDADPGTLLERFSATRRRHPLSDDDRTLADAIEYEARLLADIRMLADLVIDTSSLDVHTLRNLIRQRVARPRRQSVAADRILSATKTARPATPTWCSTCAPCPTPTGTASCGH